MLNLLVLGSRILYAHSPGWVQALGDEEVKGLEAKPGAFGKLIGILIMVYYNPYITGEYNPLYTLNNQVFFHGSDDVPFQWPVFF